MALRVAYKQPIGGTTGRVDTLRIVSSTGPVADDFDSRVLYSSNWPASRIEKFTATVTGITGQDVTKSGTFDLTRPYTTWPGVLGVYRDINGLVTYPFVLGITTFHRSNGGNIDSTNPIAINSFRIEVRPRNNNLYTVFWEVLNYGQRRINDGTVMIYAFGKGV